MEEEEKEELDLASDSSFDDEPIGPKGYTLHLFRVLMITKQIRAIWY